MILRRRSSWWFLLPIFFSIIGGVIAYFIIRDDDPYKARNCLLLGAILTIIGIGTFLIPILFGLSFISRPDPWQTTI